MSIEIFIDLLIITVAGYIIYNNLKTMSSKKCEGGSCLPKQKIHKNQ